MPAAVIAPRKQDLGKPEVNSLDQEIEPQFPKVAPFLDERARTLLRKGMASNLSDDQAEYFFERCERTQLDPFENQIWPSLRQTKDQEGHRHPHMFILVQLQGFRAIGDRSNLCDGEDPVEWCAEDGVWRPEWLLKEPPVAARARVYRKDRSRPQVAVCRWDAYCQFVWDKSGREIPNAIWKRLGSHMLGKCALAGAYRGLFPRQASGVYISEELGEGPDTESEAAIEAEMTRRYARESEYWDKEKEKGNFPVGLKPPQDEAPAAPEIAPAPAPPLRPAAPAPPPSPTPEPELVPAPATSEDPVAGWRSFVISRIRLYEGRVVGSLSAQEVKGLAPWLERVETHWGETDKDIRSHYHAIIQRIAHDDNRDKTSSLDDKLFAEIPVR